MGAAIGSASVSPLGARFEYESLELLPDERSKLFQAADFVRDGDDSRSDEGEM